MFAGGLKERVEFTYIYMEKDIIIIYLSVFLRQEQDKNEEKKD